MELFRLSLPAMYGDHHVVEVKHLLSGIPGVEDVYASSCFQMVEVRFDPAVVNPDVLTAALGKGGYLEELVIPVEPGGSDQASNGDRSQFRHSIAYEQTGKTVSFTRNVPLTGRSLWPCPGFGVVTQEQGD